jgi:hypothetical protein
MWWIKPKQATSATTSLIYITLGTLMDVWTVIYYIYLSRNGGSDNAFLVTQGLFFSGLALIIIGLAVGRIGRSAREAEVAPAPPVVENNGPGNSAIGVPVHGVVANDNPMAPGNAAPAIPAAPPVAALKR